MSREEVAAALRNLQLSLDGLQRELEGAIRALPDTKRDALPDALAAVRTRLARFGLEQIAELDSFASEAGWANVSMGEPPGAEDSATVVSPGGTPGSALSAGSGGGEGTPYGGVQLRSRAASIQKMGGIPALGGGLVLPRMTPGQRPQLNATASPAAVEIMRGRLGGGDADATPLHKTGGEEEGAAPAPLVQLRATPAASRLAGTPGAAAPESELAAAMARRMQRLGVASPDKEPTAAAGGVACEG